MLSDPETTLFDQNYTSKKIRKNTENGFSRGVSRATERVFFPSPRLGAECTRNLLEGLAFIILIMAPIGVEAASHVVAALASEQRLQ